MHTALQRMLVDTIQHAAYQGQDAYGKPLYGPVVLRPARLDFVTRVTPSGGGAERTSQTVLFLNGDVPSVTARDKITFLDGTAPAIQTVRSVRQPFAPLVIDHYELLL
jgi:Minor capsid protein